MLNKLFFVNALSICRLKANSQLETKNVVLSWKKLKTKHTLDISICFCQAKLIWQVNFIHYTNYNREDFQKT